MSSEEKDSKSNVESSSRLWTFKRKWDRQLPIVATVSDLLLWYAGVFLFIVLSPGGAQSDALDSPYAIFVAVGALVLPVLVTCVTTYAARWPDRGRMYRPFLAVQVVNTFLLIAVMFSLLYWTIGTEKNFSVRLSHWSAFYFALGTLTTAGTGTIAPKSDLAMKLVSGQMIVDFLYAAVAVTLVVTRWSESRTQ